MSLADDMVGADRQCGIDARWSWWTTPKKDDVVQNRIELPKVSVAFTQLTACKYILAGRAWHIIRSETAWARRAIDRYAMKLDPRKSPARFFASLSAGLTLCLLALALPLWTLMGTSRPHLPVWAYS